MDIVRSFRICLHHGSIAELPLIFLTARSFVFQVCLFLTLVLVDCGTSGYLITKTQLAQIKVGESTKEQVQTTLGTPKTIEPADPMVAKDETWTYHLVKYASDPHTGVPPIGMSSWLITRNRPRPTVVEIRFASSNIVTTIQELPRK